jgi:hypothetical protein
MSFTEPSQAEPERAEGRGGPADAACGSGSSVQSQSLALTSTGSTVTSWSRASRTIWAGA